MHSVVKGEICTERTLSIKLDRPAAQSFFARGDSSLAHIEHDNHAGKAQLPRRR